jgi:hypothetical protein
MSLARLLNQPMTIQTVGSTTTDALGDQVKTDLGPPANVLGFLEQTATVEHLIDRDTEVTNWHAFFPAGTVIGHLDYVNVGSQKFQVDGEPWLVYNPRTKAISHISCKLVVTNA